jgi:hypothetical protein
MYVDLDIDGKLIFSFDYYDYIIKKEDDKAIFLGDSSVWLTDSLRMCFCSFHYFFILFTEICHFLLFKC